MTYAPQNLLGCSAALLFSATAISVAEPGNVLLILADDLGNDGLARFNQHAGASTASTPTIDSLADEGVLFTRAYAYPTCSPTRAAIMTGRYGFRTGVLSPTTANAYKLLPNEFTLPEALLASGAIDNRLASIGKWHLDPDVTSPNTVGGWPHFSGAIGGGLNSFTSWQKTVDGASTQGHPVYATTVIFIGDNGTSRRTLQPPYPDGHNKGSVYEGGVRVPLIVTGKAVANELKGTSTSQLVHAVDLYATILQLFEVEPSAVRPRGLVSDSRSFLPILTGGTFAPAQTAILAEKLDSNEQDIGDRAATEGEYKLIRFEGGSIEFYDVSADQDESDDLSQSPLSDAEAAAHARLLDFLDNTWINRPTVDSVSFAADGDLEIEIGWFVDSFSVWSTDDLANATWQTVDNPTLVDDGGPTLKIKVPRVGDTSNFYSISVP